MIEFKNSGEDFRHEAARKELLIICEAFKNTEPNTKEEERLAERLINDIILKRFDFNLGPEDIAPHRDAIEAAGKIVSANFVSEANAYEGMVQEMKSEGVKELEAEQLVRAKGHLPPDEIFRRLKYMVEMGILDVKRFSHVSFLREHARKEIKLIFDSLKTKERKGSDYERGVKKARVLFEEYKNLGFLNDEKDGDLLQDFFLERVG